MTYGTIWHTLSHMTFGMESAQTPRTEADVIIGQNVHTIIWKRGIRQRAFAERIGISDSVLSKRLRGVSAWSAQDVLDVAEILGIDVGKLYVMQPTVAYPALELATSNPELVRTVPRTPLLRSLPTLT